MLRSIRQLFGLREVVPAAATAGTFGDRPPGGLAREPRRVVSPPMQGAAEPRRREPRGQEPRLVPLRPASQVFTPTRPKTGRRQLVGREVELERVLQALQEDRAHVVLYAERGRGKTSLSNLVVEALRRKGSVVARTTCDASSDFSSIMHGLMEGLPASLLRASVRNESGEGCAAALPDRELRPSDVVQMPGRLACRGLVCLIDEFDRVEDDRTRTRLADTIKQISDRDVDLRFLIVGVANDLEQILGQHPSIQRNLLGIQLPLFSDRDVANLIVKGGQESGYEFLPPVVARIVALSRGMPYIAQLLGLRLAQAAETRGALVVSDEDFLVALQRMVGDASPRVQSIYGALTDHGRDSDMVSVLRHVATAPQDAWGRLLVRRAADGTVEIGGRAIAAATWERLQAARILQPSEPQTSESGGSGLFSFAERNVMHHALLLAALDVLASAPRQDAAAESMVAALAKADFAKADLAKPGITTPGRIAAANAPQVTNVAPLHRLFHRA